MHIRRPAERLDHVYLSGIREIYESLTRWAAAAPGRKPIPFHFGMPDFDTPEHIKAAAVAALDDGFVRYTSSLGIPELRAALTRKFARENGIIVDPESELVVTCGANEAISAAVTALINPGDEVIIPDPAWPHYESCLLLAGATPVRCPLRESLGFEMDPDDVAALWTSRTRMVVINSPHNPTGAVMAPEAVNAIADLAQNRGAWLMSDEAYEHLLFEGVHASPAARPEVRDSVLTIGCLSKTYAMTGWRLGYVAGPAAAIDAINRVHLYTVSCAVSFVQRAAVAALDGDQGCVATMRAAYRERRDLVVARLRDIPGVAINPPKGAFYAFPNVQAFGRPSKEIALRLVEEAGVGAVHGSAFGPAGEGYLRLAYACSKDDIEEGVGRMATVLGRLGRA
ncbi:pyridoxal phosphate-dependent aminotransferase [soil metagenome]|nr:pyridoxal phosphate-dependent aminotransferase [Acidobacteriota bacterium]